MSIPANIVEGRRQESEKEFARFLRIALNSACELEYRLIVACDIGAMSESDCESLLRECIEGEKNASRPAEQTWRTSGPRAASDRRYESSQRISCKAFSSLLRYSRTERTSYARPVRGNYLSVLGDRPCNDDGDVIRTPAVQSILNKLFGNLLR